MLEAEKCKTTKKEKLITITLDAAHQKEFKKTLKCGIYKELRKRDILSDAQLSSLLERNF